MSISDGDLVELARGGDPAALRLLLERYRPSVRARALRLCGDPHDADDIAQESLLQAFTGLDRLHDPDRFAGWLAGIVLNVHRAHRRRARLLLLADWPEWLHPVSEHGLPSAEDLDRADALREAVAGLPAGQRRAVEIFYYADLPAGSIGGSAGAAKTSLHKARRRLREHITAHRPDLIPALSRRTPMTSVRIAHAEPRPGDLGDGRFGLEHVLVVLVDDSGGRALPLWLAAAEGYSLWKLVHAPHGAAGVPEEATGRLLRAAGVTVTGVDVEEIGPDVTAARINLRGPAGSQSVTARIGDALAVALVAEATVRVGSALMDRLAQRITGSDVLSQFLESEPAGSGARSRPPRPAPRLRREPQNLGFDDGLDGWLFGGSFRDDPTGSHWQDYTASTHERSVVLASAVSHPHGSAFLGQAIWADEYRDCTVSLRGEIQAEDVADRAELHLQVVLENGAGTGDGGGISDSVALIASSGGWASYEVAVAVPADARALRFGISLSGVGRVTLRHLEMSRSVPPVTP
jgi:RNA polymerase sigma-70 factor, ECF subfamily